MRIFTRGYWSGMFGTSSTSNEKGQQLDSPLSVAYSNQTKVNFDQSLQLSSFWSGITRWSETLSSLPLTIQSMKTDDSAPDGFYWANDYKHPLNDLLTYKMNRYQTYTEFMREMVMNLKANGNAYALISKDSRGRITSLLPLSSTQMEIEVTESGEKMYIYHMNGQVKALNDDLVWHVRLFGNNVIGMSPIQYGANSIGLGLKSDEQANRVMKNAAKPSGILTYEADRTLTDKQRAQLKQEFAALKEGSENVLMTIESGWKYEAIGLNPADIQLLDSRKFTIQDIGRFLDVPSILLNDSSASTGWGSGITQIIDGWYKLSLRPMATYVAKSMAIKFLSAAERKKMRFNFDFDELLQLSRSERVEANQKEINSGTMTPNEARVNEGRETHEDGDKLYINTALIPLDQYDALRGTQNATQTDTNK
ncbi:MAG: phage portal protein [Ignavibacteriaceae bacterium]|nr:phage portal protein [Ignavibacteriaceae bacterium]